MIPHHSIATSKRANISDPRVRKLAGLEVPSRILWNRIIFKIALKI